MAGWYYLENGGQVGPVSDEELLRKTAHNELHPDDLVWSTGMPDWVPVSTVVDIEDGKKAPPPAPGSKAPPPPPGATAATPAMAANPAMAATSAATSDGKTAGEEWFYTNDGEREGPLSILELGALYKSRKLAKTDLVWSASLGDWTAAAEVDALTPYKPVGLAAPPKKKSAKKTGARKKKGIVIAKSKTKISTSKKSKIAGLVSTGPIDVDEPAAKPSKAGVPPKPKIKISSKDAAKAASPGLKVKPAGATPPVVSSTPESAAVNPYSQPATSAAGPSMKSDSDEVDSLSIDMLSRTRIWVRIMSVLLFIWCGLILLGMIFTLITGAISLVQVGAMALIPMVLSTVLSLCMVWLIAFPARKLWGYGTSIRLLELSKGKKHLRDALDQQRSYWMFTAIMTLIMIIVVPIAYLIFFVVMMLWF